VHENESPVVRALIEKVALGCRILGGEGLSSGAFGHVSVRLPDGRIAIKSRGPNEEGMEFATASDIVIVDLHGNLLAADTGRAMPNEAHIHLALFRQRSDVHSVVHIHPAEIVALRASGRSLLPLYGAYDPAGLRLALDMRVYPKSILISSPALGDELAAVMGHAHACVLDGHGIATAGASIEEAVLFALAMSELGRVNALAAQIGTPVPISTEDTDMFRSFWDGTGPRRFGGRTDTGEPSAWHYYARRDAIRMGLMRLAREPRS
jgi:ribulose-5-phosphate 4-epimerase/fuculose-1-phosphate aldolase